MDCRILRHPSTFVHKSKECTECFELLAGRNILVLPRGSESAHPIYVEVREAWESVKDSEIFQLTKEQAIFVECRLSQIPSLRISHKLLAGFFDGQRPRFFDALAVRLPFADKTLRPLPVANAKRFAYLNSIQRTINPYRAQTAPITAPVNSLLALLAVTTIDGQHRETLLPNA